VNQLIEATLDDLMWKIEKGTGDWVRDWVSGGVPRNYTTGRRYHGVNILLLWSARDVNRYPSGDWATYKQWAASGRQVKGGETSTAIFIMKDALKKGGDRDNPADHYRLMRCAFVFNAAQLVAPPDRVTEAVTPAQRDAACDRLVAATGALIGEGEQPLYRPAADMILIPPIGRFMSAEGYYATLFHELAHWTGHKDRLDRHEDYAFEELVAELGAAFTCSTMGVAFDTDNTAAYLRSWLRSVRQERGAALMRAASLASKAHDFIVSRETKEEDAMAA